MKVYGKQAWLQTQARLGQLELKVQQAVHVTRNIQQHACAVADAHVRKLASKVHHACGSHLRKLMCKVHHACN